MNYVVSYFVFIYGTIKFANLSFAQKKVVSIPPGHVMILNFFFIKFIRYFP